MPRAAPPLGQAPRTRGRLGCFSLLLLMVLLPVGLQALLSPWALQIGGRWTPLGQWTGLGAVEASNGGKYVLYVDFTAGWIFGRRSGSRRGGGAHGHSDTLQGTGVLCTESGATDTFDLAGRVDAWRTTDGAKTWLSLRRGTPERLPSGWDVAWHGAWNGPALELASPDNSFTEVFTPRGTIRHVTSTADAGTAKVTLRYGSRDDFEAACRALRGR
ncbi:MAG TPA: hypothetical protein VHL80_15105 [Polyangia bacterium]|nr:hypothetical protein [Polyangia bacterium]